MSETENTIKGSYWPAVIERVAGGEARYDLPSRMLKDRIMFISGAIDDSTAASICMQLLFLESDNPEKELSVYINSPGGIVSSGLAIYDTMQFISSPVATVCIGQAASMGSLLLAAGEPGMRYALPHARIMVHQPLGGFRGQASDVERHAREMLTTRERLYSVYAKHTGQDMETISKALERDTFLSAEEAKEFGLIDEVITKRDRLGASG